MGRVNNKVAIVTGAASGLGKSDAEMLSREGATVVLTDISEDAGREVAKNIAQQYGRDAIFLRHD